MAALLDNLAYLNVVHNDRLAFATVNVGADNDEWNSIALTLPDTYRLLQLLAMSVIANSAQTIHPAVATETCQFRLDRAGSTIFGRMAPRQPMRMASGNVAATGPDSWIQSWDTHDIANLPQIRPADILFFEAPPADDGGTPTGNYTVNVMFGILKN